MVLGFNHSGIVVQDLDKMVRFYRDDLGLKVLHEVESVAGPQGNHTGIPGSRRSLVFVGRDDEKHRLELVHYIDPKSPDGHLQRNQLGAAHVCFDVEDLARLHGELVAKGIEFVTAPLFTETPEGTRGIVYCQDPEGNWVELIQPPRK